MKGKYLILVSKYNGPRRDLFFMGDTEFPSLAKIITNAKTFDTRLSAKEYYNESVKSEPFASYSGIEAVMTVYFYSDDKSQIVDFIRTGQYTVSIPSMEQYVNDEYAKWRNA